MKLRFVCPVCLRKTLKAEGGYYATTIHDLTCPKCGARFRFRVEPKAGGPRSPVQVHHVTNTARLKGPGEGALR